jgi:predicted ABC-class ATPase
MREAFRRSIATSSLAAFTDYGESAAILDDFQTADADTPKPKMLSDFSSEVFRYCRRVEVPESCHIIVVFQHI